MSSAYYNEHDAFAAAWLRELIKQGLIPDGEVDERSIEDVRPLDVASFTQCHWFAGIGGWPYAMRLAGWPDNRPVWTGSCPCQPFSAAGKGGGFADERHLWPAFHWLIGQCRPDVLFGEQVEGPAGRAWIDLVSSDLEGAGYAFGTAVFPAAGVGAPHIRHRTYWMADANAGDRGNGRILGNQDRAGLQSRLDDDRRGDARGVAEPDEGQRRRRPVDGAGERDRRDGGRPQDHGELAGRGGSVGLVFAGQSGLEGHAGYGHDGDQPGWDGAVARGSASAAGADGGVADAASGLAGDGDLQRSGQHGLQPQMRGAGRMALPDEGQRGRRPVDGAGERDRKDGGWPEDHGQLGGRGVAVELVTRCEFFGVCAYPNECDDPNQCCERGRSDLVADAAEPGRSEGEVGTTEEMRGPEAEPRRLRDTDELADAARHGCGEERQDAGGFAGGDRAQRLAAGLGASGGDLRPGPTNGEWRDADWLFCRDGKWRPVEPGTQPLASRISGRVGQLRGYGNAIVPAQAAEFVRAYLEIRGEP